MERGPVGPPSSAAPPRSRAARSAPPSVHPGRQRMPGSRRSRSTPRHRRPASARAWARGRPGVAATLALASPRPLGGDTRPHRTRTRATPVIVRLERGSDPDAQARAAAARGARITFVYHDVFPGYAAVLPPGGLRGIEGGPGVVAVDPDAPVRAVRVDPATARQLRRAPGRRGAVGPRPHRPARAAAVRQLHLPVADGAAAASPPTSSTPGSAPPTGTSAAGSGPGFTAIDDGRGTDDCAGHGTHVAGTIGGAATGWRSAVVAGRGPDAGLRRLGRDVRGRRRDRLGGARPPQRHPGGGEPEPGRRRQRQRRRRDPRAGRRRRDGRGGRGQRGRRRLRARPPAGSPPR